MKKFETILLDEAFEFIHQYDLKTRKKILSNIRRAERVTDVRLFKKLSNDIWEFRTRFSGKQYRILAFWDTRKKHKVLVLATHGFVKKTSKVAKKEIVKAIEIRNNYFNLM